MVLNEFFRNYKNFKNYEKCMNFMNFTMQIYEFFNNGASRYSDNYIVLVTILMNI